MFGIQIASNDVAAVDNILRTVLGLGLLAFILIVLFSIARSYLARDREVVEQAAGGIMPIAGIVVFAILLGGFQYVFSSLGLEGTAALCWPIVGVLLIDQIHARYNRRRLRYI